MKMFRSFVSFKRRIRRLLQLFPSASAYKSYSQEGEDMIMRRLLSGKVNGIYVDIGAHHPFRFSNTYHFYRNGWRGINIDPRPGIMRTFDRLRPRDKNIECAIGETNSYAEYYCFAEPAFNGFNSLPATNSDDLKAEEALTIQQVKVARLDAILEEHLDSDEIDFLSIDIEGYELGALKSNDWQRFRPNYIIVEILFVDLTDLVKSDVYQYLNKQGYRAIARSMHSTIFQKQFN